VAGYVAGAGIVGFDGETGTFNYNPDPTRVAVGYDGLTGAYNYNPVSTSTSAAGASAPVPLPAPTAPHLQFSPTTIGAVTMLSFGRARLPGQIIFAEGITATNNVADTSSLTFAASYCEPINPVYDIAHGVVPLRMWANGTLFYDVSQGGVISVANLTAEQQDDLQACIDTMGVYLGSEEQTADPVMEYILGAGNVPAYRGLRYIRFTDFTLAIAGNSVPNVSVEWGTNPDSGAFNVSDIMGYLVAHVIARQLASSGALDFEVDGVINQAYGLTITDQSTLADHFTKHKQVYSYQFVDGDPIRIVRRLVDSSLVINLEITERDDCIRRNGAPAVTFSRIDPTTLPVAVNVNYTDVTRDFDTKMQPFTYDGTGTATATLSVNTDYATDPDSARTLAFDIIFQIRSMGLTMMFEIDDIAPQVSDIIQLTTNENNVYVALVDQQTYTKNRSNQIGALALLTSAGASIPGDGGIGTPNASRLFWPQDVAESFPILVTGGRIWSGYSEAVGFNDATFPKSRTPKTWYFDSSALTWADVANWVGEDNLNVYFVYQGNTSGISILRVPKSGTMLDATLLQLTQAVTPGQNVLQAAIFSGFLYIPMRGTVSGVANQMVVFKVDLSTFALVDVTVNTYSTDTTNHPTPQGIVITDNGIVLLSTVIGSGAGRLYYANVSSLSFSFSALTYAPGCGVAVEDIGYFVEDKGIGTSNESTHIIAADATTGTPSLSYHDATTDSNVQCLTQNTSVTPHSDGTSLFFMCNQIRVSPYVSNSKPYLARVTLSGMTANGGVFLDNFCSARDYHFGTGCFADGFHYIGGFDQYHPGKSPNFNQGCLVKISADFTTALVYPAQGVAPQNDDFANATLIHLGDTINYDCTWATTEPSEPVYPTATNTDQIYENNSHSVWFKYAAAATATRTLNTGGNAKGVVYTGTAIGSLTDVAHSSLSGSAWPLTFSATSGTTYWIRLVCATNPQPEALSLT
jgi:hypothetical protein